MTPALPFTLSEVMAIHDIAIEKFGGVVGIRDEKILESALAQPFQTLMEEIYIQALLKRLAIRLWRDFRSSFYRWE